MKIHPRCCANCRNCDPFDVDYEMDEEEVGCCKAHDNEVVFLDNDDYCEDFKALKTTRKRAEEW